MRYISPKDANGNSVSFITKASMVYDKNGRSLQDYIDHPLPAGTTYVVNSNESLYNWANNISGYDYSVVFVQSGTWTTTDGVNLTTSGTKVVRGECGSILQFTESSIGLSYDEAPDNHDVDYMIEDLIVKLMKETDDTSLNTGIRNCINLKNVKVVADIPYYEDGFSVYGFDNCANLDTCYAVINAVGNIVSGGSNAIGYSQCNNMINCSCEAFANVKKAFHDCDCMVNCYGNTSTTWSTEFSDCTRNVANLF